MYRVVLFFFSNLKSKERSLSLWVDGWICSFYKTTRTWPAYNTPHSCTRPKNNVKLITRPIASVAYNHNQLKLCIFPSERRHYKLFPIISRNLRISHWVLIYLFVYFLNIIIIHIIMWPFAHPVNRNPFFHECTYNFLFLACNTLRPKLATTSGDIMDNDIWAFGRKCESCSPQFSPFHAYSRVSHKHFQEIFQI